jgi:AAA15 family ATPase/GTPase
LKIKSLHLENFKRFTDLKIDLSQQGKELPKLVLLIGANGSGKSAVFDAFELASTKEGKFKNKDYYLKKNGSEKGSVTLFFNEELNLSITFGRAWKREINLSLLEEKNEITDIKNDIFYGRSAVRNTPRLTRTSIGNAQNIIEQNLDKPLFYIDADQRFENDLDVVIKQVADFSIKIVFEGNKDSKTELGNFLIEINDPQMASR